MTTDTFKTDWLSLKEMIESGALPSPKSVMWEGIVRDFKPSAPIEDASDLFGPQALRGYNFLRKQDEPALLPLDKAWLWLTFAASAFLRKASNAAWNFNLNSARLPSLMTYPKFGRALRALKLWDEYAAFCGELGISTGSFNTSNLFHLSRVAKAIPGLPSKDLSVLEVGAGTGNMAIMLWKLGLVKRYVIVDLPEMLLYSSRTIRHFLPDAPFHFAHRHPDGTLKIPDEGFLFVPNRDFARLPDDAFDLCINIGSFQEMSRSQVYGYLELFQRSSKAGGHILTLNRRKTVGDWDNNPLAYPYGPNEILRWEPDPFLFMALRVDRMDPFYLRTEKVRK